MSLWQTDFEVGHGEDSKEPEYATTGSISGGLLVPAAFLLFDTASFKYTAKEARVSEHRNRKQGHSPILHG